MFAENSAGKTPDTALVNRELVRAWLAWSLVWLTVFPLVGLLVSIKFNAPEFLGDTSWLTFGRLRPVHVNGVIFGAFSAPLLGLLYYMVPKLCGRPMASERLGWWALYGWNLFLAAGSLALLAGYNSGVEAGEYPWPVNLLRYGVLCLVTAQVLLTILRRRETGFYVSLWYAMAALVWTLLNLILGGVILPYADMTGMSNATLHGLYIHYVVGLWITPAGLAVVYYFMPLATKNALYSHRISLLGFWTLALFYPFVGLHHYVFSPIPYQHQTISIMTSMMLIVPVWAVVTNIFGTAKGRWGEIAGGDGADHYAAKFLLLSALFYLLACFQGSTEALRRMQEITHFSDFVISHSHGTIFGTFVVGVVGGMYYVWPRVTGRQLWSAQLASWHLWLTIAGSTLMFIGLAAQGFIQGSMLEYGANFVDTLQEMMPWWLTRTLAGATMDIGLVLMMVNFWCTARHGLPFEEPHAKASSRLEARPAGERADWLARSSAVLLIAGLGFFAAAVLAQGVIPGIAMEANANRVTDAPTGMAVRAADYTPMEQRGREVYIREGCWYCHSQYIRPIAGETLRWGPLSQPGEYAWDRPHMLGTRRIGPDLSRVGRKYGDDWHAAHHWDPRQVVPDSVMPRFPWLFGEDKDGMPRFNEDGQALLAYVQRLGTGIGDWRETFGPTSLIAGDTLQVSPANRDELLKLGGQVYRRRCAACHGDRGDGNGRAAAMLTVKPRDFTTGIFKFHSTPGADALPTDQDLYLTISHGLWGTAMPPWYDIPDEQRMAVVQFIKTFSVRWANEEVGTPVAVPSEPAVNAQSIAHGRELYAANCGFCHGDEGHGDGVAASGLQDAWGHPAKPADYTLPAGAPGGVKLGHDGAHLFRTVMNGVGGTPMPAFAENMSPADVWDTVHFVQSLRIAAHMRELQRTGLAAERMQEARRKLWRDISAAANKGRIETAVLAAEAPAQGAGR